MSLLERIRADYEAAELWTVELDDEPGFKTLCPVCRQDSIVRIPSDDYRELTVWCRSGCERGRVAGELDARRRRGEPKQPAQDASRGREVLLTPASRIRSERMRWLARMRIPLRGLTAVAGEKGLGKSTYTNGLLPAQVTRGTLEGELSGIPADVLVLTGEDDWRVAVKPRLQVNGADLERVHRVWVRDQHGEALLTLPDDVPALEARIVELRGTGRRVAMLVIDPIGAFVPDTANTHADAPVRRILAPLAALAERQDIAIPIVMHLTKDETKRMIHRVSGAGAFVNAARSVLAMVRDPDDPDGEQGFRRLIVHASSNWGRYAPTIAAHLEGRLVDTDDGERDEIGYLVIDGETSTTLDDVQRGPDEDGEDAEEAIALALEAGPRPSREVKTEVSTELKCARKTVERAAVRMHERGELTIESGGFPRTTTWTLASGDTPSRDKAGRPQSPYWENDSTAPNPERPSAQWGHAAVSQGPVPTDVSGDDAENGFYGTPEEHELLDLWRRGELEPDAP